jgi:hypothetical protein
MARKTVNVKYALETANNMLQTNESAEAKAAVCTLIESILFETGNYNGFRWQDHVNARTTMPGDVDYYDRFYF